MRDEVACLRHKSMLSVAALFDLDHLPLVDYPLLCIGPYVLDKLGGLVAVLPCELLAYSLSFATIFELVHQFVQSVVLDLEYLLPCNVAAFRCEREVDLDRLHVRLGVQLLQLEHRAVVVERRDDADVVDDFLPRPPQLVPQVLVEFF